MGFLTCFFLAPDLYLPSLLIPFNVFTIEIEYFDFKVFWHAISRLYSSHTYIIQQAYKLIINYTIQIQYQTNIILKFKIFLNNQN